MRITSKGQVTIPQQVRRELGLEPGDEVVIEVRAGVARIVPTHGPIGRGPGQSRGSQPAHFSGWIHSLPVPGRTPPVSCSLDDPAASSFSV